MRRNLYYIIVIFLILGIGTCIYHHLSSPGIAFVRSSVIIENYVGFREAKSQYQQKVNSWNENLRNLENLYDTAIKNLEQNKSMMSRSEIRLAQEDILIKERRLENYRSSIEKLSVEENEKLTQGALNQINAYIQKYAEKHHIRLVLGVTLSGNIIYGSDCIDITEEILKNLNESYK